MSKANPSHAPRAKSSRSNAMGKTADQPSSTPTVSARWLLGAMGAVIVAAALCAWGALCLMFWQGSWQLLYHPSAAVTRTPANVGLAFDDIGFAATEVGLPRLHGWLIPAAPDARYSRYTAIYLHGATGNLGDTIDTLASLHSAGLNVFAFDYRGYGQSQLVHPSEAHWREDADWALQYLTGTRHVAAGSIVLVGNGLGANLALEVAAAHPDLAGVVLDEPLDAPTDAIFRDPRARLVPAHLLVRDHWEMNQPATSLRIPSLWFCLHTQYTDRRTQAAWRVTSPKVVVWLACPGVDPKIYRSALLEWLDDLPIRR